MKYYVTIKVEETIEIDYALSESEAIKLALQCFVPNRECSQFVKVVEVWDDSDEE